MSENEKKEDQKKPYPPDIMVPRPPFVPFPWPYMPIEFPNYPDSIQKQKKY